MIKFDIKDINYMGIITALLLTLLYFRYELNDLNIRYENDSYTRVMNCFKDVVTEPEFCKKFYKGVK